MLFKSALLVSLATLSFAAPNLNTTDPNATLIVNDLLSINTAIENLIALVEDYDGSTEQTVSIAKASGAIHAADQKALADCKSFSGTLSVSDSRAIVDTVKTHDGITVPDSLRLLQEKKPFFDQGKFTAAVKQQIDTLAKDHSDLTLAIGSHLASPSITPGLAIACKIFEYLDLASQLYSANATAAAAAPKVQIAGACKIYYSTPGCHCDLEKKDVLGGAF